MDLSILIPSRREMFLAQTVKDLLENIEADTEIIAVLDGAWADPGIPQHERVNLVYIPEAVGQRAATNLGAMLAKGRYIMKVDAHCAFDKGFDRIMLEGFAEVGDDVTMVPVMRNLWAFDWKCYRCGSRWYQGPTPTRCMRQDGRKIVINENCQETKKFRRKLVWKSEAKPGEAGFYNWKGKRSPANVSYCFDSEPHFQYHQSFKRSNEGRIGAIIGYKLTFDIMPSVEIINLLTYLANSHQFSCSRNSLGLWQNMPPDTMSLPPVDHGGSVRTGEIFCIGNKSQVEGIATAPIFTDVVNYGYISTSSLGNRTDEPSIGEPMCEGFLLECSTPSVSPTINTPCPDPTTRRTLNSNTLDKFNSIFGGEFVYSEKRKSFHNGNVSLIPVHDKGFSETMSLQGSCFMATREKFVSLPLCDESFGSWGNQGLEVACRTWLSGGRVLVNHSTWYAHMFRTQGGDFSFPYPQSGRAVQETKRKTWDCFLNGAWKYQIYPISWLVEKFWPVPGWTDEQLKTLRDMEKCHA